MIFPKIQSIVHAVPRYDNPEDRPSRGALTRRLCRELRTALRGTSVRVERTGPYHFYIGSACYRIDEDMDAYEGADDKLHRWYTVRVLRRGKWIELCRGAETVEEIAPPAIN
jgi:hypothetical protein